MTQNISGNNIEDADNLLDDIGDHMSSPVFNIDHDSTVQEAAQYMQASNVGSLLVKEFDNYVGIVTETDPQGGGRWIKPGNHAYIKNHGLPGEEYGSVSAYRRGKYLHAQEQNSSPGCHRE